MRPEIMESQVRDHFQGNSRRPSKMLARRARRP
jgi:hypothetical protein